MDESSVSIHLDQCLDQLGFSENDIKERICMLDKCTIARTLSARKIQKRDDIDRIIVGSQREGIGLQYIDDTDVLQIYKSCVCFESSDIEEKTRRPEAWLELDGTRTHPGHYFLKAHGASGKLRLYGNIKHLLIQRNGETFLSADKFMAKNDDMFATSKGYLGTNTVYMRRQGPSWQKRVNTFEKRILTSRFSQTINDSIDYVRGLPCVCTNVISKWLCRKRKGNWPSLETMLYVAELPVFMVPVAQKGTAHADLQWRLCFITGEMYMLRTLNNTHMKVYVILKYLAKYVLRPVCPEITSFILKNVLFWQAESTPVNDFRPDTLVTCVRKALEYLKECLQRNNLPYYMVPERNLLLNKLTRKQRRDLVKKLDLMMNEPHYMTNCLLKIGEDSYLGHLASKSNICKCSVLNAVDLAKYMESLFNKKSYLGSFLYHMWTVVIPMTYTYGLNVFRDPLRIDIPLKMDVVGSFVRSQLTYTEPCVHTVSWHGQDCIILPVYVEKKVLPGDILQVEELVKYSVRQTDISINVYWNLHETITKDSRQNKNGQVIKTIEMQSDHCSYDIVGSNNARIRVIRRIAPIKYRQFLLLMLLIALNIKQYSDRSETHLAIQCLDECYFKLLTVLFEYILTAITVWKFRACWRLDVYIHRRSIHVTGEGHSQTSGIAHDSGIAEHCTIIARKLSPI